MSKGRPGTLTHGLGAYTNGRCKCEVCHEAYTKWRREKYGQRPWAEYNAEREPPHGTESRSVHRGCRCAECVKASTEARKNRRHRNAEADREYQREYKRRKRAA